MVKSGIGTLAHGVTVYSGVCESARPSRALGRLAARLWYRDFFAVPYSVAPKGRNPFCGLAGYVLGFLTLVNPFLYSYANTPLAKWNNLIVGAMVLSLSVYQDWKDEAARSNHWHRGAHS
jgi:hypothetical protein